MNNKARTLTKERSGSKIAREDGVEMFWWRPMRSRQKNVMRCDHVAATYWVRVVLADGGARQLQPQEQVAWNWHECWNGQGGSPFTFGGVFVIGDVSIFAV